MGRNPLHTQREPLGPAPLDWAPDKLDKRGELRRKPWPARPEPGTGEPGQRTSTVAPYPGRSRNASILPPSPRACLADPCRPAARLPQAQSRGWHCGGADPLPPLAPSGAEGTLRGSKNESLKRTKASSVDPLESRPWPASAVPCLPASIVEGLACPPVGRERRKSRGAPKAIFFGAVRTGDSTISNRNTNERRNAATHSEPITSQFLIATKMHFSEEKAKRE